VTLEAGTRLGPYQIVRLRGKGGMGEVYEASDTRLDRHVAIKVLPDELRSDPARRSRFEHEARVLSRLEHPGICRLYDVGSDEGATYLVMELLEGETLEQRLDRKPLDIDEALAIATQLAEALAAAHAKGLIHRDLKPSNVVLTARGAKILDFGLAKSALGRTGHPPPSNAATLTTLATEEGKLVGTLAYMSPEQARGEEVDRRTDVWAFGCVLYELVTGRRPFGGDDSVALISRLLSDRPDWGAIPDHTPGEVRSLLERCLEKDPARRLADIDEARKILTRVTLYGEGIAAQRSRRLIRTTAAIVVIVAVAAAVLVLWMLRQATQARWARQEGLVELQSLAAAQEYAEAFALATRLERVIPDDPQLAQLWSAIAVIGSITTEPDGADVYAQPYAEPAAEWRHLGQTPLRELRLPVGDYRWRLEKTAYEPRLLAAPAPSDVHITEQAADDPRRRAPFHVELLLDATTPAGMVAVPSGLIEPPFPGFLGRIVEVGPFFIDRLEVTNAEYQSFVDAGGYQDRVLWTDLLEDDEAGARWAKARDRFVDGTGYPGPAGWVLGRFPEGAEELPVTGVSWYEAAAYCSYRDSSLPTIYHWARAAFYPYEFIRPSLPSLIPASNLSGSSLERAGASAGLGPWGTLDMAGNAREWVRNRVEDGRYVVGGAWNDPPYALTMPQTVSVWDRSTVNGFRCMRYGSEGEQQNQLAQPIAGQPKRDYTATAPVSDEVFALFLRQLDYLHSPLTARVESEARHSHWIRQKISYAAAYEGERALLYLFLPLGASPPHRVLVFWPGVETLRMRDGDREVDRYLNQELWTELVRGGTALAVPVLKGMWQRGPLPPGSFFVQRVGWKRLQDLHRAVDYLETREDISAGRIGFLGLSWGGNQIPFLAGPKSSRFRVAIAISGGYIGEEDPLEWDPVHWAPRVEIPTLLLNGELDYLNNIETQVKPLLRSLGTSAEHKRLVAFRNAVHWPLPNIEVLREMSAWLDRYLGPVAASTRSTPAATGAASRVTDGAAG
jgi:formylglycine-generating enzyme required for sulfatase activity/predicted Ser/Thr protein kinase